MTDRLTIIARAIAMGHYSRKTHTAACSRIERLRYLVDKYWKTFVPDAQLVVGCFREIEPSAEKHRAQMFSATLLLAKALVRLENSPEPDRILCDEIRMAIYGIGPDE